MRKINWSKLKTDALSTAKAFPVELILSLCFFAVIVIEEENLFSYISTIYEALFLLPLFWTVGFALNHLFTAPRLRWIYYSGLLLSVAAFLIDLSDPPGLPYTISWVIAFALVFGSRKQKDNLRFTIDALRIPYHLALSYVLILTLVGLLCGIYASLVYIFDLNAWNHNHVYFYLFTFPLSVVAPFLFCLFQHREQNNYNWKATRFFEILNNWILSPALLVYTTLLYVYGLKILFTWNLPKGMLSYMIATFLFIAVVARACQKLLKKEHYNWFYNRFHLIAIPILVLFWIGVLYRIQEYGFTEERVYLFIFAILISILSLLSFQTAKSKYVYFSYLTAILLAVVTFIPPINAQNLGLLSQQKRLNGYIQTLGLKDPETGLIQKKEASEALRDSSTVLLFDKMAEVYQHLINETSPAYMEKRYGYDSVKELTQTLFAQNIPAYLQKDNISNNFYYTRHSQQKINIAGYTLLHEQYFQSIIREDSLFLKSDSVIVTAFDLSQFLAERPALLLPETSSNNMDSLLYLKNDSCMALINYIEITADTVSGLSINMLLIK